MIIGIMSDPHVHTWKSFDASRTTLLSKQTSVQDDILNRQIYDIFVSRGVKLFLCGGDWFQNVNQIPVECLNIVDRFLNKLRDAGIQDESATGNHDLVKRVNPEWFHNVVNIFRNPLSREPKHIFEVNGAKIGFINYEDEVDYDKYVGLDIVIVHKTPAGAKYGNHTFDDGVDWKRLADNNRLVFFGHIHQNQQLGPNAYVIGPPMPFNFGETGDCGIYLIDTDIWSVEFVKLEYPEFRTVEHMEQVIDDYNYYRVLDAEGGESKPNAVVINKPRVFDQRIKADGVHDIAKEWIKINNKDESYFKLIEEHLNRVVQRNNTVKDYRLDDVSITNFISIGSIEYWLNDGFTLVSGKAEGFSSNGSGKTAIVDAIYWALFGKTTKGLTGDDVIRRGQKDCKVRLSLSNGTGGLTIERSRKEGICISRGGQDLTAGLKQPDRQAMLEQLLGFGESLYLSSCYFSQESLTMLTDMTDVDRTNMVSDLLGFNIYDELYVLVTEIIKRMNADIVTNENSITQLKYKIGTNIACVDGLNRNMTSDQAGIKSSQDLIKNYEAKVSELKVKEPTAEVVDPKDYNKIIEDLQKEDVVALGVLEDLQIKITTAREDKNTINGKLMQKQAFGSALKSRITELNQQISNLEHLHLGEKCDKCGAEITAENAAAFNAEKMDKRKSYEQELEQISSDIMLLDGELQAINIEINKLNVLISNTEDEVASIRRRVKEANSAKFNQAEAQNRVTRAKDQIAAEIKEYENAIKSYKDRIVEIQARINKVQAESQKYLDDNKVIEGQIAEKEFQIKTGKAGVEAYEFWKTAFSPKGIKSLLLDKFCNDINLIVNNCLSIVSNGVMSVTVTPTSTIKSGEERNKLGIEISMGGAVVRYESLSGGEKRRVDFSLCMALNQYIANKFNLQHGLLGLIIMDELFSYLDKSGEELIGRYLMDISTNRSILVITHTDELTSYGDRYWTVVKQGGVSKLEVN